MNININRQNKGVLVVIDSVEYLLPDMYAVRQFINKQLDKEVRKRNLTLEALGY